MRRLGPAVAVALVAGSALWWSAGVAVAGGGGGCLLEPPSSPGGSATGSAVEIAALCFQTPVLYTETGSTVTWTNNDSVAHTVTGAFGSKEVRPGKSIRFTFAEAGVYPYACVFHPGMVGAVVVGSQGRPETSPSPGAVAGGNGPPAARTAPADRSGASRTGLALVAGAIGLVVGAAGGLGLRWARRHPVATAER